MFSAACSSWGGSESRVLSRPALLMVGWTSLHCQGSGVTPCRNLQEIYPSALTRTNIPFYFHPALFALLLLALKMILSCFKKKKNFLCPFSLAVFFFFLAFLNPVILHTGFLVTDTACSFAYTNHLQNVYICMYKLDCAVALLWVNLDMIVSNYIQNNVCLDCLPDSPVWSERAAAGNHNTGCNVSIQGTFAPSLNIH